MASILHDTRPAAVVWSDAFKRRAAILAACLVFAGAAYAVGNPAAWLEVAPETAQLLRGMALLKATIVVAALAAVLWRVGSPIEPPFAFGYGLALAAMTGAAVMVWQLSFLHVTSFVFHASLIALIVLAWRDDGVAKGVLRRR